MALAGAWGTSGRRRQDFDARDGAVEVNLEFLAVLIVAVGMIGAGCIYGGEGLDHLLGGEIFDAGVVGSFDSVISLGHGGLEVLVVGVVFEDVEAVEKGGAVVALFGGGEEGFAL